MPSASLPVSVTCPICSVSVPRVGFAQHASSAACSDPSDPSDALPPPAKRARLSEEEVSPPTDQVIEGCENKAEEELEKTSEVTKPKAGRASEILALFPVARRLFACLKGGARRQARFLHSKIGLALDERRLRRSAACAMGDLEEVSAAFNVAGLRRLSITSCRRQYLSHYHSLEPATHFHEALRESRNTLRVLELKPLPEASCFMRVIKRGGVLPNLRTLTLPAWAVITASFMAPPTLRSLRLTDSEKQMCAPVLAELAKYLCDFLDTATHLERLVVGESVGKATWAALSEATKERLCRSLKHVDFKEHKEDDFCERLPPAIASELTNLQLVTADCWSRSSDPSESLHQPLSELHKSFGSMRSLCLLLLDWQLTEELSDSLNDAFPGLSGLRHLSVNFFTDSGQDCLDWLGKVEGLSTLLLTSLVLDFNGTEREEDRVSLETNGQPAGVLHAPQSLQSIKLRLNSTPWCYVDEAFASGGGLSLAKPLPGLRRLTLDAHPAFVRSLLQGQTACAGRLDWAYKTFVRMEQNTSRVFRFSASFAGQDVLAQFEHYWADVESTLGEAVRRKHKAFGDIDEWIAQRG